MSGTIDYIAAVEFAKRQAERLRRQWQQIASWANPGPKNRFRGTGRYTGEVLRKLRAERGVGRPPKPHQAIAEAAAAEGEFAPIAYADALRTAVRQFGSQRKAAEALGISLGKLQRALKKAA